MKIVGLTYRGKAGRVKTRSLRNAVLLIKIAMWPAIIGVAGLVFALLTHGWIFYGHTPIFWKHLFSALFWNP